MKGLKGEVIPGEINIKPINMSVTEIVFPARKTRYRINQITIR
jgi:hypothetical protein